MRLEGPYHIKAPALHFYPGHAFLSPTGAFSACPARFFSVCVPPPGAAAAAGGGQTRHPQDVPGAIWTSAERSLSISKARIGEG